jgi:two-component system, NtrC family, sensor kinase
MLTLLYARTKEHDPTFFFENVALIRQLKQLDSRWELDVMKSRIGINSNYDSLVDPLTELNRLRDILQGNLTDQQLQSSLSALTDLNDSLRKAIEDKTRLVEHFKSHNSVLHNSLAFLPIAARDVEQAMPRPLVDDTARKTLLGGINQVLLDSVVFSQTPSDDRAAAIGVGLARLTAAQSGLAANARTSLEIFESHARTVLREQPEVNALLNSIAAVPTAMAIDAIDNALSSRQRDAEFRTQQYRRYLLIFAAVLLALVVYSASSLIRSHAVINRVNKELQSVNASLEERVRQRTRELQEAQKELVTTARRAGMAEIAKNVLHNVGNVLNSLNVSAGLIDGRLRDSKLQGLVMAIELMNEHAAELGEFFTHDEKGRTLPRYLNKLVAALVGERQSIVIELGALTRSVEHIKEIVATQQSYSRAGGLIESVQIADLLEDAVRMNAASMLRHRIAVVRKCAEVPMLLLDRHLVLQILINLIGNARQAMAAVPGRSHQLTLSMHVTGDTDGRRLQIRVEDDGEGIAAENVARLFSHGFTTRKSGHGFGLHSCALAAKEMSGTMTAHSEGLGKGASFTLELPVKLSEVYNEHGAQPARLAG